MKLLIRSQSCCAASTGSDLPGGGRGTADVLEPQAARRDARGPRAVVRNGCQPEREILTGIGAVAVSLPKVRDRSGEEACFRSVLVPPYVCRARSVDPAGVALPSPGEESATEFAARARAAWAR